MCFQKPYVEFERHANKWQFVRGNRQQDGGDGKKKSTRRTNWQSCKETVG